MKQINPQFLREWRKEGELLVIWRCENCFKKIPLYKTDNELVNMISLSFARNEKYCLKCKKNMGKPNIKKKNNPCREIFLLRRYEGVIVEEKTEMALDFVF